MPTPSAGRMPWGNPSLCQLCSWTSCTRQSDPTSPQHEYVSIKGASSGRLPLDSSPGGFFPWRNMTAAESCVLVSMCWFQCYFLSLAVRHTKIHHRSDPP